MKALILRANADLKVEDIPLPVQPASHTCLLKVQGAGICGSDLHRAFENGAYHYPLIMGHEFSGVVEESFAGSRFKKGQRVVCYPLLPCGSCSACQTGDYAQCEDYDYFGSRRDGSFAEYLWVPEENLFPVPDHVDLLEAAMTEPCAVSLHGVRKLDLQGGETAAVLGGGPIGNMTAQWLRILGCGRIMIIDIDRQKLRIAGDMGFDVIHATETDPVACLMEKTGGKGADTVIEACGLPLTLHQALRTASRFGQVLLLGTLSRSVELTPDDMSAVLRNELRLYGTWNSKIVPRGKDDWSTVLRFLGRELQVAPLISHTPSLEKGPEIFRNLFERKEFFNKVIFRP